MSLVARSPVQFAVVREDPRIERALVVEHRPRRVLLVASGGCTALALRAWFPDLEVVLVDPNPAQLAHVEAKRAALRSFEPRRFNVGDDDPRGLHELGNFERLFRLLRRFLDLFVVPRERWSGLLADPREASDDIAGHPYWPVAFDLVFADSMLLAMFGPDAVQHAVEGSYPGYFRSRIEAGLRAPDRATNPWLHHVLLGHYLPMPEAWPPFLRERPSDGVCWTTGWTTIVGRLSDVPDFAGFDLVQLSNVLDWMSDDACRHLAERLSRELSRGSVILWRQLNDPRPLTALFAGSFAFDAARDLRLAAAERSLFYDQVHAGVHR